MLKNTILLFLGGFLVVVIAIIAVGGSGKVLATWKQPITLNYNSYGPYNLSVVEKGRIWNTLGNYRYYSIIISADSNSAYGHSKYYSFTQSANEVQVYLQDCEVKWDDSGVTFIEPTGHILYFPTKAFIGGR